MTLIYHSQHGEPVRVTVTAVLEGSQAKFGVSRCSKKDHFVKKVGRERALERATINPLVVTHIPKKESLGRWFVSTARGIAEVVKNNPELTTI